MFSIQAVSKAFGPVQALDGVGLDLGEGEIHAVIGENGAGKSTLMKILSGAYRMDSGAIFLRGRPYHASSPAAARAAGVAMIYQELTLAPHLTVEQNITLGNEATRHGFVRNRRAEIRRALDRLGHGELDVGIPAGALSIGLQQLVEIARALVSDARVIIMDEPTSSLSEDDKAALFRAVRRLRDTGISVLYVSHFLKEVQQIADRYTVLRDGRSVAGGATAGTTIPALVEAMVGRAMAEMYPRTPHEIGEPVLDVCGLQASPKPQDASFGVRRGEILGIAGLVGAGRSEALRAVFGLVRACGGTVALPTGARREARRMRPWRALGAGVDLLSEDRSGEGLAVALPVGTNVTLSALGELSVFGFIGLRRECGVVTRWCEQLHVKCRDAAQPVAGLSGGNQQKIALARILNHDSDVLLFDEPTRGIDIGSKSEIYRLIGELAARGKAIVLVSSYLPELFGVCDTLAVMHRGRLSPARPVGEWDNRSVMRFAAAGPGPADPVAEGGGCSRGEA